MHRIISGIFTFAFFVVAGMCLLGGRDPLTTLGWLFAFVFALAFTFKP